MIDREALREKLVPTEERKTIDHFERRIDKAKDFCAKIWEKSQENHRFIQGGEHQWEKRVYMDRQKTGRPTFSINDCALGANALSGMEITKRFERIFVGTEERDRGSAEALTRCDRQLRAKNLAEYHESDKFRDLGIEGYSCLELYMDYLDDFRGKTMVRGHDTWHVIWDHSARLFNLMDREWDAVGRWVSIDEFLALFPRHREAVTPKILDEVGWINPGEDNMHRWPWLYRGDGQFVDPIKRDVFVVDYEWREKEGIYVLEVPQEVENEDGSVRQVRTFKAFNEEEWGDYLTSSFSKPPDENVIKPSDGSYRWRYRKAKIVGDTILEEGPCPISGFSRQFMTGFPFKQPDSCEFQGLIDYMKDPQRFKNAITSLLVSTLERVPKGGMMVDPAAFETEDLDALASELAKPFPLLKTKPGIMMGGQKFWEPMNNMQFPAGFEHYAQLADMAVWRPTGMNPNVLGQLQDPRRVSGRVWSSLTEAGQTVMSYIFNALRLYRLESGRAQLQFFERFYDQDQLREMVGPKYADFIPDKGTPEWEQLFSRDVVVDEAAATTRDDQERTFDLISRQGADKLVASGILSKSLIVKMLPGLPEPDREEELQRLELTEGIQTLTQQLQQLQAQAQQAQAAAGGPPQQG